MNSTTSLHSVRTPSSLFRRLLGASLLLGLVGSAPQAAASAQREGAPLAQLNLNKAGLALEGYDPVAYFPVGGGQAKRGKQDLSLQLRGVTYRFANEKNRESFLRDPERFEPGYGGWCAYAMASGDKVEVDPKSFLIEDGRLLVFYDGLFNDTRKSWLKKGSEVLRPRADTQWHTLLGWTPDKQAPRRAAVPKLALEGMDPTTLDAQGMGKPGSEDLTTRIGDLEYRFVHQENRIRFLMNPEHYPPKAVEPVGEK